MAYQVLFFEQQPCVLLSFRSSGVCLRSRSKDQPKWVTDVELVRLLPEHKHQTGPAEGSQWEAREARARASMGGESYLVTSAHAASSRLINSTDGRERSVFRLS